MSRLLLFGCSFTYGQGLSDCYEDISKPSQLGYATILGQKLNLPVYNFSCPGLSPLGILHRILDADIDYNDTVVIQWSNPFRGLVIKEDGRPVNIGIWQLSEKNDLIKNFYKVHNNQDLLTNYYIITSHADLYLKTKCKKYFHIILYSHYHNLLRNEITYKWYNIERHFVNFFVDKKDATPCLHPGVKNNQKTADRIYQIIVGADNRI